MRPLLLFLLLALTASCAKAQALDTLEALLAKGKLVDAKIYLDGITDTAIQNTMRFQLAKGQVYQELFKQSLELFGIKNNNWLVMSCNAYVDGVTQIAKYTRVPDSLFLLITDCYENTAREGALEQDNGSIGTAEDLYFSAHYSATLWGLLSGGPVKDTAVLHNVGMYFYQRGQSAILPEDRQTYFARAKYYLNLLAPYNRPEVVAALKEIEGQ